jgi:hypothetical protein
MANVTPAHFSVYPFYGAQINFEEALNRGDYNRAEEILDKGIPQTGQTLTEKIDIISTRNEGYKLLYGTLKEQINKLKIDLVASNQIQMRNGNDPSYLLLEGFNSEEAETILRQYKKAVDKDLVPENSDLLVLLKERVDSLNRLQELDRIEHRLL